MPLSDDLLVERFHLRRRLSRWRFVTLAMMAIAIVVIGLIAGDKWGAGHDGEHIARIKIQGVIFDDPKLNELIEELAESDAKAVLIAIDSPGGTTAGAEALYDGIRKLSEKKPTVAVVGTLAASGGYIAALAADHIVSRQTSLVGSIGVIIQYPNFSKLLDTVGVKVEEIKTSPLKAAPNGFEPTSPEARQALEEAVQSSFQWFKQLVQDRRKLNEQELQVVSDGRVFTGNQGLKNKLVDSIGGEEAALAWLNKEKGISDELPIENWEVKKDMETWRGLLGNTLSASLGIAFGGLDHALFANKASGGLVSLWQPPLQR